MQVKSFVFSPFAENTYVVFDQTKEAVIIDPGCLEQSEKEQLKSFIEKSDLKVVALLQTHCHLDHVFGSAWVKNTYNVDMHIHKEDLPVLKSTEFVCQQYGIKGYIPVEADKFLEEGDVYKFGESEFKIIHVPGHAPGHIAFIAEKDEFIIGGDCLFRESIGRTDFPLCSHQDLINSIKNKFFALPDNYIVYSGHMEPTTIGHEKKHNPFLK